jgi:enterochelin esterase-like enzyme/outer membrane protein assembly factor BamB
LLGLTICIALLTSPATRPADWPRWRGPNQDGIAPESGMFGIEPFALKLAWSRPLGLGYSGISVVDGRLVTMLADGEFDDLVAIDVSSGEEIWRYRIAVMSPSKGGSEGGPTSVPSIDDGIVYGLGARGDLFAVRMKDGSELWSKRLDRDLGAPPPHFGFTTAPLVVDDLLFVQAGGADGRSLVGLRKTTGEVVWSVGDDAVAYQSPILATLAGRLQIVAYTGKQAMGLVPESGEILWSHEHGMGQEGSSSPVMLGGDRILLPGYQSTAAIRISRSGDGYAVDEVWRSSSLKGSFATPVVHEEFIYGFSGDFLTCVSAEDGETVWKSRPPGGNGLIVVDGHLVIFGAQGAIVVAQASPDGFEEKTRVKVSEHGSQTYPSFADGTIFVRNTRDIAAVTITHDIAPVADRVSTPPANDFEAFVRKIERSEDSQQQIDEFMNAQERFPIVERNELVHFVYRGNVDDVAITGTMTEVQVEEPLERIGSSDLYYKTYPIEAGARWEYRFNVDFENPQPDPLNPRRVPSGDGEVSELVMPGWTAPRHIEPYTGSAPGRVESFELQSKILGNTRQIKVYLPPGYDGGTDAYPILILEDGEAWLELADLPNSLNNLIGNKISPLIAVFVEMPKRAARDEMGGPRAADHVRMLADELVPRLDESYRTLGGPESRGIVGTASGALMAAFTVIERPEVFGKSGGLSIQLFEPLTSELMTAIEQKKGGAATQFLIIWNRYELRREDWGLDFGEDSRRMMEALRTNGYDVDGGEVQDGAGWGSWRAHVAELLESFFPL